MHVETSRALSAKIMLRNAANEMSQAQGLRTRYVDTHIFLHNITCIPTFTWKCIRRTRMHSSNLVSAVILLSVFVTLVTALVLAPAFVHVNSVLLFLQMHLVCPCSWSCWFSCSFETAFEASWKRLEGILEATWGVHKEALLS